MVLRCAVEPEETSPRRFAQGHGREELAPGHRAVARDQSIRGEALAREEHAEPETVPAIEVEVGELPLALDFDPELTQERPRHVAVREWRLDAHRSAVADEDPPLVAELVALGVSSEVVVVVEDEDPALGAEDLPVKVGRGQAGQAAADDHQVVGVGILDVGLRPVRVVAIPRRMRRLEGAGMAAAQAGESRRVVVGVRFGREETDANWQDAAPSRTSRPGQCRRRRPQPPRR